jgi:short-subunit dehydrogenase
MANVVITGSTKGVGRGLAAEFIKRGHNVAISSRKQADISRVAEEFNKTGPGKCTGVVCDITRKETVQDLWNHARAAFGRVDIWINNAGRAIGRHQVHELPERDIEIMVDINLKGTIFASQVAISGFREQGSGAIYNVLGGSYDGRMLSPDMGVYSSTKSAIWRLTQYLIKENKNRNIMIGTISPGMLITENWFEEQKHLTEAEWQKIKPVLNILCDHVETSTPWLVEQILANKKNGRRIAWLTNSKMIQRFIGAKLLGYRRDLFSCYGLT